MRYYVEYAISLWSRFLCQGEEEDFGETMYRKLSADLDCHGFLLVNACGFESFASLRKFVTSNSYFDLLMFLPVDYAKHIVAAKYSGRVEDVKALVQTKEYQRAARTMGVLDQVFVKPRGPKSVLMASTISVVANIIDNRALNSFTGLLITPQILPDLMIMQGRMKESINTILNAVDKMHKRLLREYSAIFYGDVGGSLKEMQDGGDVKVLLTLARMKKGCEVEEILCAEKARIQDIQVTVIAVGMTRDGSGNRIPDFQRVGLLFKKAISGTLNQVKFLIAHMDQYLDIPVLPFFSCIGIRLCHGSAD